jgi:hypothetical protein
MADCVEWTISNMEGTTGPTLFELPMTPCGTEISSDQTMRLPVNEQNQLYENDFSCSWTISNPAGASSVTVTFLYRFSIEASENGCWDKLTFTCNNCNGDTPREVCGTSLPEAQTFVFEGAASTVDVSFTSDGSVNGVGFAASIVYNFE